jgi:hypothetical protein
VFTFRTTFITIAAVGGLLAAATPAHAATRYAAPASTDAVGACSSLQPCTLAHAVGGAASGDEVVVEPGTYSLSAALAPSVPLTIRGVAGEARPRLVAARSAALTMVNGGEVRHLYLEGRASMGTVAELEGVIARRLEIYSPTTTGVQLNGAAESTVLADSVVRTTAAMPAIQTKNGKTDGPVKLLNATVYAPEPSATAIKVKHGGALGTFIRSSVIRGGSEDVRVYSGALGTVDHSNLRPGADEPYTDGGGNQQTDPMFTDAANGDLRPLAGSPLIDAGVTADGDLGAADLEGVTRSLGAASDIGAYEFVPEGTADPYAPVDESGDVDGGDAGGSGSGSGSGSGEVLAPPAPPAAGRRVGVDAVKGSIRVRQPGSNDFVEVATDASVPVGSTVDASAGVVELTTARDASGEPQTGKFWGGRFKVSQKANTGYYTELKLAGGSFASCNARAKVSAAGRRRVRQLWGRDNHGRFRTRGRGGHATVRGTRWLTRDRCDGTLFKVTQGAIDVKRKGRRGKVRVDAGERFLAKFRWRRRGRG